MFNLSAEAVLNYYAALLFFFSFAQRARCASPIFFFAAADNFLRLGFIAKSWPLTALFAQRSSCAMLIFLRAEVDIVRLFVVKSVPFT